MAASPTFDLAGKVALIIGGSPTRAPRSPGTSVNVLFEGVVARHGRLDIVVHVPGAVLKKPLADTTDAELDHLIRPARRSQPAR